LNKTEVSELVISYSDKYGSTNKPERRDLQNKLRKVKSKALFDGLFSIFLMESCPESFARQNNAGLMLFKIKPKVKLEPLEMLRVCLPTWDVSVEELVFYFVEKCGKEEIGIVLEKLKSLPLSERESEALKSMHFWFEKA
jgi:hypothetical protein|tara:strand:- start:657 stop:1076 length:420 start_codon:yes stop_codon:yes gene_type:complete